MTGPIANNQAQTTGGEDKSLREQLRAELDKSILLDDQDHEYWLNAIPNLPLESVRAILKDLKETNAQVDKYLGAAIESDPDIINRLKTKIKQIQITAFDIDRKAESKSAEEDLETQLKQI